MCKWYIERQGEGICQYSYFKGKIANVTKCEGKKKKCKKGKWKNE